MSTKYWFSFLVHWFYHFWGSLRIAKRLPETADNTLSACFVHTSRFTAKVIRLLCPMLFLNLRVSEREHRVLGIPGYRVSLGSQLMPVSDPSHTQQSNVWLLRKNTGLCQCEGFVLAHILTAYERAEDFLSVR